MSRRLTPAPARRVIKALNSLGFEAVRQSGSHVRLRQADGRAATVAVHGSRDIPVGTLRSILRQAELAPDEFMEAL